MPRRGSPPPSSSKLLGRNLVRPRPTNVVSSGVGVRVRWGGLRCGLAALAMACVSALMLERDPTLTPLDVRLILESTASDLGLKGRNTQFGWGLVSPARALAIVDERKRQRGSASTPVQR